MLGIIPSSEKSNHGKQTGRNPKQNKKKSKAAPHGKSSEEDFPDAEFVQHKHTVLKSGDICPECQSGKIYKYEPAQFIRITGQAPLKATIHVIEQLRCNTCSKIFKAEVAPDLVKDGPTEQRFGYSARAMIAMQKYCAATPFYRQHMLQKAMRVPISTSTLWDQCEEVANAALAIYLRLIEHAANGWLLLSDDTSNRILKIEPMLKKKRHSNKEQLRTGVHTSGIVAFTKENREIVLYKTGINHAGEFLDELLSVRLPGLEPPLHMSDALSSNTATVMKTLKCLCNSHCRRLFVEQEENHPDEVEYVKGIYSKIYEHEAHTKEEEMSTSERLAYHRKHSLPLMEELLAWAKRQFDDRLVEPNSPLGGAIKYLLKHQTSLMAFCFHEGAPLDNNLQENKLRLVVLHRKNALFFKEEIGAKVADIIMSVCATAVSAGVNVHEYLIELQRNKADVKKNPDAYLPWVYQARLTEEKSRTGAQAG